EIHDKPTRLPKLLSYPSELLTSNYLFDNEADAIKIANTYPDDTFIITFTQHTQKVRKKPVITYSATAIPVSRVRGINKRTQEAYKSSCGLILTAEDSLLWQEITTTDDTIMEQE